MQKKSSSKMKVVSGDKAKASLEKMFETARSGMLATLEVQLNQDDRFDTLYAIRESYHRFYFDHPEEAPSFDYAKSCAEEIKKVHQQIVDKVLSMTLDEFKSEEFTNPADELVKFDDPDDWEDVFFQSLLFSAVQPYGENFDTIHGRVMEEVAKNA